MKKIFLFLLITFLFASCKQTIPDTEVNTPPSPETKIEQESTVYQIDAGQYSFSFESMTPYVTNPCTSEQEASSYVYIPSTDSTGTLLVPNFIQDASGCTLAVPDDKTANAWTIQFGMAQDQDEFEGFINEVYKPGCTKSYALAPSPVQGHYDGQFEDVDESYECSTDTIYGLRYSPLQKKIMYWEAQKEENFFDADSTSLDTQIVETLTFTQ